MPKRIEQDHKEFRKVVEGKIRKSLGDFIKSGHIFKTRPNGKTVPITIPELDLPRIVHGGKRQGAGRGEGKDGDIIQRGPQRGKGKGQAGEEEAEGIQINLDLEEVLRFMQNELHLPDMKPKPNDTLEQEEIKYTSLAKVGPQSLRHNKRTMLQAMKRMAATGEINNLQEIPGYVDKVRMITPINSDRRYRQYKVIKKPSSNAVIFFARDCSGSVSAAHCDVISDICWWIDIWIRRFYERVERCYIIHDAVAHEVDDHKFYTYRSGGGTKCSTALKLIVEQFENRFPPSKWNIYAFYFTDGENWGEDNNSFIEVLKSQFTPEVVNFVGIAQIMSDMGDQSLKNIVDQNCGDMPNLKTTEMGTNEERFAGVKKVILELIGNKKTATEKT